MKKTTRKFWVEWKICTETGWSRSTSWLSTKAKAKAFANRILACDTPRRLIEVIEKVHRP